MSNKPHLRISDHRRGLVEVTVGHDEKGRPLVWLELFPPGAKPVQLPMSPDDTRGLAQGLLEGAAEAEAGERHAAQS